MTILNLVEPLHVPCGNHDTWNTTGKDYIDYHTLVVHPFTTSWCQQPSYLVLLLFSSVLFCFPYTVYSFIYLKYKKIGRGFPYHSGQRKYCGGSTSAGLRTVPVLKISGSRAKLKLRTPL